MKNNIELYPIETLTEPKNGVYRIYKENNIMKFKGMSWQCNAHKEVVETLKNSCYPECTVVQIPYVYSKISE